jgi:hypothetical protein
MEHTYEIKDTDFGQMLLRSDGAWIPTDPRNADYQAYLNRDNPDWGKPLL